MESPLVDPPELPFPQNPENMPGVGRVLKWLACPVIFSLSCWMLLLYPEGVASIFPWKQCHKLPPAPSVPPPYSPDPSVPSPPPRKRELSPEERKLLPGDLYSGWRLGRLAGILEGDFPAKNKTGNDTERECLAEAAQILGVNASSLTREKLLAVGGIILAAEIFWGRDFLALVLGLLTVVNVLWCLGVCGIACSVGPVLYYCLQPVADFLLRNFVLRLRPFLEPTCFACSLLTVILSPCLPPGPPRDWLAILGFSLFTVTLAWSRGEHFMESESEVDFRVWWSALVGVGVTPVAIQYNSSFLGFCAVLCLYSLLSYLLDPYWGNPSPPEGNDGYVPESAFFPYLNSCLVFCLPYFLLKSTSAVWMGHSLSCFLIGCAFFGPFCLLALGLLAWLSRKAIFSIEAESESSGAFQMGYVLLLTFFVLFGHFGHYMPLFNLGSMFSVLLVLAVLIKATGKCVTPAVYGYVIALLLSLVSWLLALFLHSHPDWLLGIFQ